MDWIKSLKNLAKQHQRSDEQKRRIKVGKYVQNKSVMRAGDTRSQQAFIDSLFASEKVDTSKTRK